MRRFLCGLICLFFLIITGCGKAEKGEDTLQNDRLKGISSVPEYQIIARYADLGADSPVLEGVWQSECIKSGYNNSIQASYTFYLDGAYIDRPLFNGLDCTIKSSQVHSIRFGRITSMETIELFNGTENVTFQQLEITYKRERLNRKLRLEDISWDALIDDGVETRIYRVVANRLYSAEHIGPGFDEESFSSFFDTVPQYVINSQIDTEGLTEFEIDDMAAEILGDL